MAIGRKVGGVFDYCVLGCLIHAIGHIWLAPGPFEQRLDAAIIDRRLVALEPVARHAHDLAGLRHVAQLLGQVQKAGFLFDDLVSSIQHCGFLVQWFGLHHHQNGQPSSLSRDAPSPFQLAEKGAVSDHIETNSSKCLIKACLIQGPISLAAFKGALLGMLPRCFAVFVFGVYVGTRIQFYL